MYSISRVCSLRSSCSFAIVSSHVCSVNSSFSFVVGFIFCPFLVFGCIRRSCLFRSLCRFFCICIFRISLVFHLSPMVLISVCMFSRVLISLFRVMSIFCSASI